jgi:drug/metabolite transporter (DMT)-like permease
MIYEAAETILEQQLGALWAIAATVCFAGGCIVFSRQCVGK